MKVDVEPLNILKQAIDTHEEALAGFFEKHAEDDPENMSDEDLAVYDSDWARAIIDMVKAQLTKLRYRDAETLDIHVVCDDDEIWRISTEDLQKLDSLIIYYP